MTTAAILTLALIIDALIGEPRWIWSRIPHPAVLMGRLIHRCDRAFNRGHASFARGSMVISGLVVLMVVIGWLLSHVLIIEVAIVTILLAHRSLVDHVSAVAKGLRRGLREGRVEVAKIVGRDTAELSPDAVARAAIESGAENFSDGVVAPVFWYLLAGLPGLLVYKIVNTADSMIGYRTPAYEKFGKAAARLDDALNLLPAQISALLIALVHGRVEPMGISHDASKHRSPNAGWPEAAMARAIGVALAGPRSYEGESRNYPWVHADGRRNTKPEDIDACVRALWRAWAFMLTLVAAFAGLSMI